MSPVSGPDLPCRGPHADLFFADEPPRVDAAKRLCTGCPVQAPCLDGALRRREPWGVWGGQQLKAGEVVTVRRPRGRPRKHPLPVSS
jgi:WhiB family redox-sensing transcriptional regulator